MEYKDYYKILGLERGATQDEIKSAYRKLARTYHPDINKEAGAEARFKEVGEAYEVLKDTEKRAAYDQLGTGFKPGQEFRPPPNWDAGFEYAGASGDGHAGQFDSEFFETLFGRMRRAHAAGGGGGGGGTRTRHTDFNVRGEDRHARIMVDLRDSFEGARRDLSLRVPEVDAQGHVGVRDRTLAVQIPKGILAGQHIRLKGQGDPGLGKGEAGDLYLEVEFKPDPLYRVHDRDLYVELPVAPWEAALGASVRMPTPGGVIMLKVPAGSASGRELRVKGRGIPSKQPGDLYAVLRIVLPPASSAEAKDAYEALRTAAGTFDPRSGLGD